MFVVLIIFILRLLKLTLNPRDDHVSSASRPIRILLPLVRICKIDHVMGTASEHLPTYLNLFPLPVHQFLVEHAIASPMSDIPSSPCHNGPLFARTQRT